MGITDRQAQYAQEIATELRNLGFRVKLDLRKETINFKIREHSLQKIPYKLTVGDRELAQKTVSVRAANKLEGEMTLEQFSKIMHAKISQRGLKY
jgi:threonyl-tRNA synthetase